MVRRMRISKTLGLLLFAGAVSAPTLAHSGEQIELHPVTNLGARPVASTTPSATPSAAPDAGRPASTADASTATTNDAGASDETADQHARRKVYVDKTAAKIRELVHANGKHVDEEEREAIRRHWRHTMRLWRIRNLAETDNDKGIAARADGLLDKADKHLFDRLKALNAKAPVIAAMHDEKAPMHDEKDLNTHDKGHDSKAGH